MESSAPPRPRWIWRGPADPDRVRACEAETGLPRPLAETLVRRNQDGSEGMGRFLDPSIARLTPPTRMSGLERAASRLFEAIERRETVCVYGDYDVDGVTATALLLNFYRALGLSSLIRFHIPDRIAEGYGLNQPAVERLAREGVKVIVTVDTGISAVEPVRVAQALGVDVIVTDHHVPPDPLPPAFAILNPKQPGCGFGFKSMAGVGIAWYLAAGLRSRLRDTGWFKDRPEPNLKECLDLVVIGTVADISPLLEENRILVREGLEQLARSTNPGVRALMEVAELRDGRLSPGTIGFQLGPRLNAAGRLGTALEAVELLTTSDPARAREIARSLDEINRERRRIEREIFEEACDLFESNGGLGGRRSICLAAPGWHEGVIGIVASRLVERYHRPTLMIALREDGTGKASARSIEALDLHAALERVSSHLIQFGGHYMAAGFTVEGRQVDALREAFEAVACERLDEEDLRPSIKMDAAVEPEEIGMTLAEASSRLAPFGPLNPEPTLLVSNARVTSRRILSERHLKLDLGIGDRQVEAIGFNLASREVQPGNRIEAVVAAQVNEYRDRRTLQLKILDFQRAETPGAPSSAAAP